MQKKYGFGVLSCGDVDKQYIEFLRDRYSDAKWKFSYYDENEKSARESEQAILCGDITKHSKILEGGNKHGVAVGMGVQILAELVCSKLKKGEDAGGDRGCP